MAYVSPEYWHDIFFSYPHADADGTGNSELKAWSQKFAKDLRNSLLRSRKYAEDLSFFLDQGARDGERLDEAASPSRAPEEARNAALLIALMSPWYLGSRWCAEEREAWAQGIEGEIGEMAREFGRAFVVRVQDTEGEPWPSEFVDAENNEKLGFWFYDRDGDIQEPFGLIGDKKDKGKYRRAVALVKTRLLKRLDELHRRFAEARAIRESERRLLGLEQAAIYVHARESDKAAFDDACGRLFETEFYPVNLRPEPLRPGGGLTDEVEEQLRTADALLLLGTKERELSIDMVVVGKHARNLANAKTPKKLPGAVLDKIGAKESRNILEPRARMVGLEWLDGQDDWTTNLHEHLARTVTPDGGSGP